MSGYLLDTNLLIALLWPKHDRHRVAVEWFERRRSRGWATCALTEAGFVRIVSNPAFSRDAVTPREAVEVLAANTASPDHAFWPMEIPLVKALVGPGTRLVGHQQVTDACLLGLAVHRRGILATLDRGVAALVPEKSPGRDALEVIG